MFKNIFQKDINKLYLMTSLVKLGSSFVNIFIPIYFLSLGYTLNQVFIYYIIQNSIILAVAFIISYFIKSVGFKIIFLMRFLFLFIFLLILYNIQKINFSINYVAIIDGVQVMFYWFPLHILFAHFTKKEKMGSAVAKLFSFPKTASLAGPLLGSLIIVWLGFHSLFAIAIIIFIIASLPIFYMNFPQPEVNYSFSLKRGIYLYKKYKKLFYAEISNNIGEEVEGVIWPIFVFISLANYISVGIVGTLLQVSLILFALIIGHFTDRQDKIKILRAGVFFVIFVWFLRYLFSGALIFYILTILAGVAFIIFSVPYYSILYKNSQKEKTISFFAFREIPVFLARIFVFGLGILLVNLKVLFLIAGLVYLPFLFWKREGK